MNYYFSEQAQNKNIYQQPSLTYRPLGIQGKTSIKARQRSIKCAENKRKNKHCKITRNSEIYPYC